VQGQGKKDQKTPTAPLEAEKVLRPGQYVGKLVVLNGSNLVFRLEFVRLELKPGAQNQRNTNRAYQNLLNEYSRLSRAQQQLVRARTPQQQISALRQIQTVSLQIQRSTLQQLGFGGLQNSPYVLKKDFRDIEVELAPNVEVRTFFLPFVYDDMGNPKKYTKEELKELKGPNPNVPGYKSDLSALKQGQAIKLTLARVKEKVEAVEVKKDDKEKKDPEKKDPPKVAEKDPPKVAEKDPPKVAEKDPPKVAEKAPDDKNAPGKFLATRILILEESDDPVKPERPAKKNK